MNEIVTEFRSQALDSPYATDRREAIEKLGTAFEDADGEERAEILRTFAEVARESSHRDERELAREKLLEAYETDPADAAEAVVRTLCRVAIESKFSGEREAAIDQLRHLREVGLPGGLEERVRETFLEIASESTYEDERRRARDGLAEMIGAGDTADPTPDEIEIGVEVGDTGSTGSATASSTGGTDETVTYLAVSLAEHLESSTDDPDDCRTRLEELRDFVSQYEVTDDAYADVRSELEALGRQLETAPIDDGLDEERRDRIERVAERVERLYLRAE